MLISDRIKSLAPLGAQHYRLLTKLSDGTSRLFPADPQAFFRVGEAPTQVPIGKYTLCFYDSGNQLINYIEDGLQLSEAGDSGNPAQLPLSFMNASGGLPAPARTAMNPMKPAQPPASAPSRGTSTEAGEPPARNEADLEFRRHLHAMDLEERQQEFIKNSTYVTELGEIFTLNRLMRRENLELHRIIVQHSQRAYQDIDQVKSTVHELLALQKAVLEHAATQIARPPTPPPDYVGLGHSALAVVKEIGVALLQRTQARDARTKLPTPSSHPQLSAPEADVSPSPSADRPDAIRKMIKKLEELTDLDLAISMSSPEGWKSLLDELRSGEKTSPPSEALPTASQEKREDSR